MSWPTMRLSEVADFRLGKMLDQRKNKGDLLPYLANKNVRWGEFDFSEMREMRFEERELDTFSLKNGDIVMCEGGVPGRCAIWRDQLPKMMYQKALHRIRPFETMNEVYLYYNLSHRAKSGHFEGLFTGSTIKHLPKEKLALVEVDVPDLPTQERIAAILSAYDDLIENNRRRIALLEQAARLLYREWFVHFRFPGHETAKFVDGLPEGWEFKLLTEVCVDGDGIQTGPFGSQLHQSDYTEEGVPVIMPKNIKGNTIDCDGIARIPEALADKLGRHRMMVGDTAYGRRGEIGRRAFIGPQQEGFFCGTGCLRIRPNTSVIDARYLFETLGAPDTAGFIVNQARGSTMPNLSAGALKQVPILYPPLELQEAFKALVTPKLDAAEVLDTQNAKLTRARDLLLPRLMDGRLPV